MRTQVRTPEAPTHDVGRPPQGTQGQLLVQSAQGLQQIRWHPECSDEVDAARQRFGELQSCGYRGYRLEQGGRVHEEVKSFDAQAQEIVMLVPLRGGAA